MINVTHPGALEHQFPGKEGITTKAGVLTGWWTAQLPTQAQVDAWEATYLLFIADHDNTPTTMDDIIRALLTKGALTPADITAAKRGRP